MDVKIKDDIKIIYVDSSLYSDNAEKFKEIINSSIDKKDRKINLNLKKMSSINSYIMGKFLSFTTESKTWAENLYCLKPQMIFLNFSE